VITQAGHKDIITYVIKKVGKDYLFDHISSNCEWEELEKRKKVPQSFLNGIEPYLQEALDGKNNILCNQRYSGKILKHTMGLFEDRVLGHFMSFNQDEYTHFNAESVYQQDDLTKLPNRMQLTIDLQSRLDAANKDPEQSMFTLMVVDMDNIKYTNESKGHIVGDELIKGVAKTLVRVTGEGHNVYRIGGDEFVILLTPTSVNSQEHEAKAIAKKIVKASQQPAHVQEQYITSTLSVGLAMYPFDGDDSETLLRNAQLAMQKAKSLGKNGYYIFHSSLAQERLRRLEIEEQLKFALFNNELSMFYQPQVDAEGRKIVGTEALMRWMHPVHGFISPAEFIPIAEETGLIISVGEWALRTACAQHVEWVKKGYNPVRMSVNLSAHQFAQKNIVHTLLKVLKDTDMDPKYLNIEITESTSMLDVDFTIKTLKKLRSIGISISIDDFGTGYSSLSYLTKLPIDTIKIDKSFVDSIFTKSGETVAKSIIVIAGGLDLNVIAEGVETEDQLKLLKTLGCREIQGYLVSPAIESSKFEAYLDKK